MCLEALLDFLASLDIQFTHFIHNLLPNPPHNIRQFAAGRGVHLLLRLDPAAVVVVVGAGSDDPSMRLCTRQLLLQMLSFVVCGSRQLSRAGFTRHHSSLVVAVSKFLRKDPLPHVQPLFVLCRWQLAGVLEGARKHLAQACT